MVTLHTMETRAAPMAPMMAAALPPPGVGSPPARRSRNWSRELFVIMMVFRGGRGSADHRFGLGVDLFGVEHEIVLLEQASDAGAMQRKLQGAEPQGTKHDLAVALRAPVGHRDAFDARGRRGIG